MFLRERRDDENTVGPHTADARATDGRLACRPRHAPMRPRRMGLRRSDGTPCPAIPWTRARATLSPAGFLARGSWFGARPSRIGRTLASGRLPAGGRHVSVARRLQLQGQPRHWSRGPAPHSHLRPLAKGTDAIMAPGTGAAGRLSRYRRLCQSRRRAETAIAVYGFVHSPFPVDLPPLTIRARAQQEGFSRSFVCSSPGLSEPSPHHAGGGSTPPRQCAARCAASSSISRLIERCSVSCDTGFSITVDPGGHSPQRSG